jgi:hypothetical protein
MKMLSVFAPFSLKKEAFCQAGKDRKSHKTRRKNFVYKKEGRYGECLNNVESIPNIQLQVNVINCKSTSVHKQKSILPLLEKIEG